MEFAEGEPAFPGMVDLASAVSKYLQRDAMIGEGKSSFVNRAVAFEF